MKVTRDYFTGSSKLFGPNGLGAMLVAAAQDNARRRLAEKQAHQAITFDTDHLVFTNDTDIVELTDNSSGVAANKIVDLVIPPKFDASTAGGVQTAALNTSLGKFENAGRVLVNSINRVRELIGLASMTSAAGTQASADTIPAQDKSTTTASGSSAVSYSSARTSFLQAKANFRKLLVGYNEVLIALGETPLASELKGDHPGGLGLVDIATVTSSADGTDSMAKAVADVFMDSLADNIATLAAHWNGIIPDFEAGDLRLIAG